MTEARAWIGLGSNLCSPHQQILDALAELDQLPLCRLEIASQRYITRPVGPQDQPDFVNAVAQVHTRLSPLALLDQLQALEQRHRRVRQRHWGPRTLDLDLLLFENQDWHHPRLTLPHPHMHQRAFVILPLSEIAPELELPNGRRVAALAAELARDLANDEVRPVTT
ncbi:2-amino-4-hydroxy-6-hydroxymethyldihydropteridine diphosphokinase [Halomonas huangheensis]|uniref:2-amino-4-hydroxy-6-hydroxymethyldihydropteridine pyrophosphokinase n=1 Tax=Halomonas huangheensis TaxID=1178482 RepID=W1N6B8_9GAMM|nr:2-amino-4-hydroxy-6-hydroxymethyldihydropteridine diphosphokinase [Halomonas huangheensis]ALM54166.1 2-amino-4-hydroxy-6-hydroxymethyldihydropteridine pyrophosphokinase [Halomonas huangheensis]ERL51068.1 hypothetical protein BJB45_19045 [Halomonas huangheensis]